MMVLSPDVLPATASENGYVTAVVGLEQAEQWQAALQGYRTALEQWPGSLSAMIGLGNVYYAQGDLDSAERVLRGATQSFPDAGVALNNLAQVLWEQGKRAEALQAARSAVSQGGPMVHVFQKTLDDIQADNNKH